MISTVLYIRVRACVCVLCVYQIWNVTGYNVSTWI